MGLNALTKLGYAGSANLGYWWADPYGHGGGSGNLPKTAEERAAWGKQGEAELDGLVRALDLPTVIKALREHRQFTQDEIVTKKRNMIP